MNTRMIHQIENQFDELQNYNLYRTDPVLQEILMRYGSQDQALLTELGGKVGTTQYIYGLIKPIDIRLNYTPLMRAVVVSIIWNFIPHGMHG